eukprot:CAMPEP_0114259276 /NCGR_PEP_ID=MMETSP0058-20121206/19805_1 /TAXON_ID=36894 /ORGANISM="Pyramimonas parkeae, CCMP726" /LENGTH=736 /DNA_ID=CAMNT_0001374309 /DNA_START=184 /DNA_END=2394 /DNA_ORIENTATION=+
MAKKLKVVSSVLDRPLNLTEKLVYSHVDDPYTVDLSNKQAYLQLRPDRVALHDATAQMALLQFIASGVRRTCVPATIHCDHLIQATTQGEACGAKTDLAAALEENEEVYDFLARAAAKLGLGYWKPGSGIIHQVLLENYALPGLLMITADSHSLHAGGLGTFAAGVGGGEVVDVMAGLPWEMQAPRVIGVKMKGRLKGWASPKDVALTLINELADRGAWRGAVIEFFGPGTQNISCTGMATICNMTAAAGATSAVCPYNSRMYDFMAATDRQAAADMAEEHKAMLVADAGAMYDEVVTVDLSHIEPRITGAFFPHKSWPLSQFAAAAAEHGWPMDIKDALVGGCVNGSYYDLVRSASIAKQASKHGLQTQVPLAVAPSSEQVRATLAHDGALEDLEAIGAVVLASACGPCIGRWERSSVDDGEPNTILTSYNQNSSGRNDTNHNTHSFVTSPEIVTAMAMAGNLGFNPEADFLMANDGNTFQFDPPSGDDMPDKGFNKGGDMFIPPPEEGAGVQVSILPNSTRLQELAPFDAFHGKDIRDARILLKVKGECTTDHISPAGPWLKYRGHLDNISNNFLIGAVNAESNLRNSVTNHLTKEVCSVPEAARHYQSEGVRWVVVAQNNFGQGGSTELGALEARHLGGVAVIAQSFARIQEMNLKRQGLLPLSFVNPEDYDAISPSDTLSILDVGLLAPDTQLTIVGKRENGETYSILVTHTFNDVQIQWFLAGSAVNALRA